MSACHCEAQSFPTSHGPADKKLSVTSLHAHTPNSDVIGSDKLSATSPLFKCLQPHWLTSITLIDDLPGAGRVSRAFLPCDTSAGSCDGPHFFTWQPMSSWVEPRSWSRKSKLVIIAWNSPSWDQRTAQLSCLCVSCCPEAELACSLLLALPDGLLSDQLALLPCA